MDIFMEEIIKLSTQNHKAEYFYSQKLMDAEIRKSIINLGKKIIEELDLKDSVDTLSRWMISYLSEKIIKAEAAIGDKREQLQIECCDLILKIWNHRSSYNAISTPFEKFKAIYEVLLQINREDEWSFYSRGCEQFNDKANSLEQKYWLELIKELDQVVKVWMRYFSYNAAMGLVDQGVNEWLDILDNIEDVESDILKQLLSFERDGIYTQTKVQKLQRNLETLKKFNKINTELIETIKKELLQY